MPENGIQETTYFSSAEFFLSEPTTDARKETTEERNEISQ